MKKTILGRDNKPYLIRYTLFTCKYFSIKLHKVLVSDTGPLHNHPWDYMSIILWGGYWELSEIDTHKYPRAAYKIKKKWHRPLSILFRKAHKPHKLIIPPNKICISLIFTSKKYRSWSYV